MRRSVVDARATPHQAPCLEVLPRGRNAAPRRVVWAAQRARMLSAMAEVVAERGYARVAVADVIERAGVSRKTFYEQFTNKEACFLTAYDAGVDTLVEAIDEAVADAAPDWLEAIRAGAEVYLEMLAASPAFARTFHIEVLAAGDEALARRGAVQERFAAQLEAVHGTLRADIPDIREVPRHTFRAAVGAVTELVTAQLLEHGAEALPDLAPAIVDVELALLIGREVAERLRPDHDRPRAGRPDWLS